MTEMLNKEFSRKAFVKGGGALVVGLSLAGAAQAANDPKAASPTHTGLNPDRRIRGRSTRGSRSTPTTRPRSTAAASTSARARRTAC